MRTKIFLCAWVIGLFLFDGTARAQPTPERINAIYASIAGDHAALYVAQEMGLFRKYGLDVNLSYIAGAAQVIQTMMPSRSDFRPPSWRGSGDPNHDGGRKSDRDGGRQRRRGRGFWR